MIAWVDVETTGLDPRHAELLEVGIIITDDALYEASRASVLVKPMFCYRALMVPEVVAMHGDFLDECERDGLLIGEAQDVLVHWLRSKTAGEKLVMAGSTVGFDRAWLREKMPLLESQFHYRSIDVSTLKELDKRWGFSMGEWAGDRDIHRALPDLEDSIAELRHYRAAIG